MPEKEGLFGLDSVAKPRAEIVVGNASRLAFCVHLSQDLELLETKVVLLLSTDELSQLLSCHIPEMLVIKLQESLTHRHEVVLEFTL